MSGQGLYLFMFISYRSTVERKKKKKKKSKKKKQQKKKKQTIVSGQNDENTKCVRFELYCSFKMVTSLLSANMCLRL